MVRLGHRVHWQTVRSSGQKVSRWWQWVVWAGHRVTFTGHCVGSFSGQNVCCAGHRVCASGQNVGSAGQLDHCSGHIVGSSGQTVGLQIVASIGHPVGISGQKVRRSGHRV